MRRLYAIVAPSLVVALSVCSAGRDESLDVRPAQEPATVEVADPMASFSRMMPGEWRVTAQSGTSMFHTWHWGPGRHSIRRTTDGFGADGNPWRASRVVYWHPGRKHVRLLGLDPHANSVMDGTIDLDGENADGVFDLHQTGGLRKMRLRWAFDGPDEYVETLLESNDAGGFEPLVEWVHIRSEATTAARPEGTDVASSPSGRLKALESLLGHTWEGGDAFRVQSTFEWIPLIEAIYARVLASNENGEPTHLMDAYFYHHPGTGTLRCLALSSRGGVYEGDLTVLDGGALQLDLTGYEGDRVVPHVVRLDFEHDGTLRQRAWSLEGTERTLVLDLHHRKLDPKSD